MFFSGLSNPARLGRASLGRDVRVSFAFDITSEVHVLTERVAVANRIVTPVPQFPAIAAMPGAAQPEVSGPLRKYDMRSVSAPLVTVPDRDPAQEESAGQVDIVEKELAALPGRRTHQSTPLNLGGFEPGEAPSMRMLATTPKTNVDLKD